MIKEQRRLALVRLQAMMASLARRDAMRALAEAIDEERRRSALAERSAALLASSGTRLGVALADELARRSCFVRGVARIADDAAAAHSDARRQTAWQADNLAAAEARARRLSELESEAAAALAAACERRAAPLTGALARKLHRPD